jgi:hypothetical protein
MDEQRIELDRDDQREGLRIWRECQKATDLMHVAENDWRRWKGQMELLYVVPTDYAMTDIMRGFEPAREKTNG